MKKLIIITIVTIFCLSSNIFADGIGSGFGSLTTANTQGLGSGNFGFGVGLADATSVFGSFTYGLSANTDGRLKLALIDYDNSDTKIAIGADFKYNFISKGELSNGPFDMALGGFFEYYDYDNISALFLGAQYIGSFPIKMSNNSTLIPYGRFNARIEMKNFDLPPGATGDDSKSDLEFGLNAGVMWKLSNTIDMYGEFQFDGNDGLFVGLDFNVM